SFPPCAKRAINEVPIMEKMKTLFRNASIATAGLAVANVSFAESLLDETTKGVLFRHAQSAQLMRFQSWKK
ncbi:hypothetical protein, partial [Pseudomonas aeruginosa]|uniref:hypothetical protein n=1 Tax=Pseudomonas aeruginosa TaxID=287 RepID=UPI001EE1E931